MRTDVSHSRTCRRRRPDARRRHPLRLRSLLLPIVALSAADLTTAQSQPVNPPLNATEGASAGATGFASTLQFDAGSRVAPAEPAAPNLPVSASFDPPLSPSELASLWEGQRTEIATAHVQFLCFNGPLDNPQNSPERVRQLLEEYDLVAQPERLLPFLTALAGRPFAAAVPAEEMRLLVSGSRRRVEDPFATFVTDGELEAEYVAANRQVTLYPAGKSRVHHYGLEDLRWIPPPGISPVHWRVMSADAETVTYEVPPNAGGPKLDVVCSIDAATGIVIHSITRYPDGVPAIEMYQSGLDVSAAGIVFPRLRIDLVYSAGHLRTARVIQVTSARFNESVDDASFTLPVPEATRIIDFRTVEKDAYLATAPAPDALALPVRNHHSPARTAPAAAATPSPARRWSILIAVHCTALLLLGGISLRKRRSAARPRP
jgi:hypothetical protein